jgi:hypothetical protein
MLLTIIPPWIHHRHALLPSLGSCLNGRMVVQRWSIPVDCHALLARCGLVSVVVKLRCLPVSKVDFVSHAVVSLLLLQVHGT